MKHTITVELLDDFSERFAMICERCERTHDVHEVPLETGLVMLDEGKRRGMRLCAACRAFWRVDVVETVVGLVDEHFGAPDDGATISPTASTVPPPSSAAARTLPLPFGDPPCDACIALAGEGRGGASVRCPLHAAPPPARECSTSTSTCLICGAPMPRCQCEFRLSCCVECGGQHPGPCRPEWKAMGRVLGPERRPQKPPCRTCGGRGVVSVEVAFGLYLTDRDGDLAEQPCPDCRGKLLGEAAVADVLAYVEPPEGT